jgi:integrative and conjugative element protein (TIGR02256 family)
MLRWCQPRVLRTHVWLGAEVIEQMLGEAAASAPLETGGMLLGYIAPNDQLDEVMVETILGPGPNANHRTTRFEPDSEWQERELARRYLASGRITTYLGDWHSRPDGIPVPSTVDRRTARTIARTRDARMPHPFMLILGPEPDTDGWGFNVYRWRNRQLYLVTSEILTS